MAPSPTGLPPHRRRPHRSSSTGSSRATRAASSGCGSRTPTRAARSPRPSTRSRSRSAGSGSTGTAPHTFQLDRMDDCRRVADAARRRGQGVRGRRRDPLPHAGRGRRPRWDDVVRGRDRVPERDSSRTSCIVRSDGRPTYNFASPLEDVWDGITHVIRGDDHISNTPKQINIIRAVGASSRSTRTCRTSSAQDGKKLSKRHGATSASTSSATAGYLPEALINFLALLGWAPDGETTIMRRDELIERFTLERVSPSPAQFDYAKLDWMNGVYLRELSPQEYAHRLVLWLGEQRLRLGRRARRADGAARAGEDREARRSSPPSRASSSATSSRTRPSSTAARRCSRRPTRRSAALEPFDGGARSRRRCERLADGLGLKPRQAFQPIRVAVTGSKVSPGPVREHRAARARDDAQPPAGGAPPPRARPRPPAAASAARADRARAGRRATTGAETVGRVRQAGGIGALDAAPAAFGLREVLCHFKVVTTAAGAAVTDQPPPVRLAPRWGVTRVMRRARILVVDDEPSIRLLCRVNLELDGHEVLEAHSLATARASAGGGRRRPSSCSTSTCTASGATCSWANATRAGRRSRSCSSPARWTITRLGAERRRRDPAEAVRARRAARRRCAISRSR